MSRISADGIGLCDCLYPKHVRHISRVTLLLQLEGQRKQDQVTIVGKYVISYIRPSSSTTTLLPQN
jgi:hypothetical protein